MPPAVFEPLVPWLTDGEPVRIARAHADWTQPEMWTWLPLLRRHGISLRHHFRTRASHDPALVALTVDALDLAATAEVDHLVLVGDVGAATPLVERLRERAVGVSAAGPASTPHAFRAVCTDFLDLSTLATDGDHPAAGRHRAT
ncbi:NYN domain-containing protein [Nocardioides sp. GXQ0305]|uniref:NYN domain-containing protein n=1 Tax=Nocardioides sp. GXQ0305 TaxID=3423912 RepID=UPI003D7C3826